VQSTKSISAVYSALNKMPTYGRAPGTANRVQAALSGAVSKLSELLTGTASGF